MSESKTKIDKFENLGGVNTKASAYLTGPQEALAIFNFDFSINGDLTGRPGSSQYFSATFGGSLISGLHEYTRTNGFSKLLVAHPGGMWNGQDNSVSGFSIQTLSATQVIVVGNTLGNNGWREKIGSASFNSGNWDYVNFVDNVFFCDGRSFLKFNGSSVMFYSLPRCLPDWWTDMGTTANVVSGTFTAGIYSYAFAWMNDRGFIGPVTRDIAVTVTGSSSLIFFRPSFPWTGFGITAMVVYRSYGQSAINPNYLHLTTFPVGTTTFLDNWPADQNNSIGDGTIPNNYDPFQEGTSFIARGLIFLGTVSRNYDEFLYAPRFLELHNNQLFMSGFSNQPSSVLFSDIGEPEAWEADFEFETRTDDGDKVTALKAYGNRLMVFKELSTHELLGDDPTNFTLRQVTDDYGCINNRSVCIWHDRCWFLDRKGICEYTGSQPEIKSLKIDDYFGRMNLTVARTTAQMAFMKQRNEVWTLIPIDGSTVNNLLIIYDITSDAWAFWDGPQIATMARLIGRNTGETAFFGDYRNRVNTFGTSFMGDNGVGFTSLIKSGYDSSGGQSVEKIFRRLFVNADSLTGSATLSIETRLRANYGTSYQVAASLVLTKFQNYENFGVSAKSLSVEISFFSAVDSMRLHGYALEYRWQRNT